jgi:hypothetical protein
MQIGHYTASCSRCGVLFWRHEDLTEPRSLTPWRAGAHQCGCDNQQPDLI